MTMQNSGLKYILIFIFVDCINRNDKINNYFLYSASILTSFHRLSVLTKPRILSMIYVHHYYFHYYRIGSSKKRQRVKCDIEANQIE